MSTSSAARMRFILASASTSLPSIVSFGMSRSLLCGNGLEGTTPELDVRLEFVAKLGDIALHRHSDTIGEHADRIADHVVRDVVEQLELLDLAVPRFHLDHDLFDPAASLAARRALTARFVMIKVRGRQQHVDHAGILVHNDDDARALMRPDVDTVAGAHYVFADVACGARFGEGRIDAALLHGEFAAQVNVRG